MTQPQVSIRTAVPDDEKEILSLERTIWQKIGVPQISKELFRQWVETYPNGFLVALLEGEIHGYAYHERVNFDLNQPLSSIKNLLQLGYKHSVHCASGNALYGVSVVTNPPNQGIGKALFQECLALSRKEKVSCIVTCARMPGLEHFIRTARRSYLATQITENDLALHYAVQSMKMVNGTIDSCLQLPTVSQDLPFPSRPDPVLGRFAKFMGMTLCGVVPSMFDDPQSNNMAALAIREVGP
jgi:hypothetical protein